MSKKQHTNPTKWTETTVLTVRPVGTGLDERVKHPEIKGLAIRFQTRIIDGKPVVGQGVYTHYYTVNGAAKKKAIGEVGAMSLQRAIEVNREFGDGMTGVNPVTPVVAQKRAMEDLSKTLGDVVVEYLAHLDTEDVTDEYRSTRALYLNDRAKSLHSYPMKLVSLDDLRALLKSNASYGKTSVDNLRKALSALYHYAISEGHCRFDANPTTYLPKAEKVARTNVPQIEELAKLWNAAGVLAARNFPGSDVARRYGNIIKLLLLTAARRNQIGMLRWSEVNLDGTDKLPPHIMLHGKLSADEQRRVVKAGGAVGKSRSKNRKDFMIVLSRQAVKVLRDLQTEQLAENNGTLPTCVFHGWNKENGFTTWGQGAELLKELTGGHWIHHDFRRSFVTLGQDEVELAFEVVDISINHTPKNQQDTNASYNGATLKKRRVEAAQAWADYIEGAARAAKKAQAKPVLRLAA